MTAAAKTNQSASKRHKTQDKTKPTHFDSSAGVIPTRTHGFGVWGGERKVVNIRIDAKLYEAVKPVLKRYFGSVCGAIEPYLATIYSMATTNRLSGDSGVIPSITVDINELTIRRHLKVRRRFVLNEEEIPANIHGYPKLEKCFDAFCGKLARGFLEYIPTGETWAVCEFHAEKLLREQSDKWREPCELYEPSTESV